MGGSTCAPRGVSRTYYFESGAVKDRYRRYAYRKGKGAPWSWFATGDRCILSRRQRLSSYD